MVALQWHMPVFCKIEGHDQLVAPESPPAVRCGSVLRNLAMGLHGDSGRGAGSAENHHLGITRSFYCFLKVSSFGAVLGAIIQPQPEEQFRDPCVCVVVFLIAKDLAEGVSQRVEILLGTRHAQGFVLMSFWRC